MNSFWDRLGISASVLCAIHCLVTPILVLSSPLLGKLLSHGVFHLLIALVIFPAAIIALRSGYRVHRHRRVLIFGTCGLGLLAAALLAGVLGNDQNFETGFMLAAGIFLVMAHAYNLHACRLTTAPGRPSRPHDHSSDAKALHAAPDIQAPENA